MEILKKGSKGDYVKKLQQVLQKLGFDPGNADGVFGDATAEAVIAFQKSSNLPADGIAGPKTQAALGLTGAPVITDELSKFNIEKVSRMFPFTPAANIKANLPFVLDGLRLYSLISKTMGLMALATIRAETESFLPISEMKSKYNTSKEGHPFDIYDNKKDLGNTGAPDGELFKGRGFIQLTGRANYLKYGKILGLEDGLIKNPDLANDPEIAAKLLSVFLKDNEGKIIQALNEKNYKAARKLVNGGLHGIENFTDCFKTGDSLII